MSSSFLLTFKDGFNVCFKFNKSIVEIERQESSYDLVSIINHTGGINSGHYTCYGRAQPSNKYEKEKKKKNKRNSLYPYALSPVPCIFILSLFLSFPLLLFPLFLFLCSEIQFFFSIPQMVLL